MAYISQEEKKQLQPKIKEICTRYGIKATLSINHHSTLVLNVKSGPIDFITQYNNRFPEHPREYIDVNPYHYKDHWSGKALSFICEVIDAMKGPGWFDKSDAMTDYFHVKHYVDVNIGQYQKPYQYSGSNSPKTITTGETVNKTNNKADQALAAMGLTV